MIKAQFRVTETEDVDNIKGNLRKIAQHILRLKDEQILLDEDGTVAFNRGGAVNSGVGSKSTITFSRNWLSHSDDRKAAELIHEASHGTEGVATKDLAYLGYWADAVIKGKSAIVNAPTYERAALAKGAETSGEEAPKGKTLTLNQGYEQHNDRFVKILGKIDFHTTQAWWFVNNISKFAKQIPSDADLKGDKNEKGYRWSLLKSNHPYVANVCAQIGAPVAKTQPPDGRTVFTPVDQELINLYVRCLAGIKDAVHLISQVNVVTEPPAKFIDDNVVNLPAGALAQSDEAIEAWIVQQVVGLNKIPESIAGSGKFYDRIVQASKWKDGVEPDIDKSGVT